jgi:hypothetical protein
MNISREAFMVDSEFYWFKIKSPYGTAGNQNIIARNEDPDAPYRFNLSQVSFSWF